MVVAVLALLMVAGCSDGITEPAFPEELVGDWQAEHMILTSHEDPSVQPDLIEEGHASFSLRIQEEGRYEAHLSAFGQPETEAGALRTEGETLRFEPDEGTPYPVSWSLEDGTLLLEGETRFDLNQDGERESVDLEIELTRS